MGRARTHLRDESAYLGILGPLEKRTTGKGESLPVWGGRTWSHCNLRYQGVCLEAGEIQSF